jgi:hypothetical protein
VPDSEVQSAQDIAAARPVPLKISAKSMKKFVLITEMSANLYFGLRRIFQQKIGAFRQAPRPA